MLCLPEYKILEITSYITFSAYHIDMAGNALILISLRLPSVSDTPDIILQVYLEPLFTKK